MTYNLIITEPAEMDLIETGLYVNRILNSPIAAQNLLDEIESHILSLGQMPERYALVSSERLAILGVRAIPVKNYLIFYVVYEDSKTVAVVRVLHGSRDWEGLLLEGIP